MTLIDGGIISKIRFHFILISFCLQFILSYFIFYHWILCLFAFVEEGEGEGEEEEELLKLTSPAGPARGRAPWTPIFMTASILILFLFIVTAVIFAQYSVYLALCIALFIAVFRSVYNYSFVLMFRSVNQSFF